MPSMTHEALVMLFRENPSLIQKLTGGLLGLPKDARMRVAAAAMAELDAPEFRADVVYVVTEGADESSKGEPGTDEPIRETVVVEVQLETDTRKRYSWPVYVAVLRARHRCPATLTVVALDERVARWCAQPIDLGHGQCVLRPVVIGPDLVPVITEVETAREAPELAVLSVAAHGREPGAERIALAALAGVQGHDNDVLYADLVYFFLSRVARQALESIMGAFNYEYQSDFARKYVAQGKAEGEAKGEALGIAESLLLLLDEGKGFEVPETLRAHVLACQDCDLLRTWYRRALKAQSLRDVFEAALLP